MEAVVIGLAQVAQEIASPGAAEAALGIKSGIEAQGLVRRDGNQDFAGFQIFEFVIVGDAGQLQAINFLVLPQQRFMRGTEHRVPAEITEVTATGALGAAARVAMHGRGRNACSHDQQQSQRKSLCSRLHEMASGHSTCSNVRAGVYCKTELHNHNR